MSTAESARDLAARLDESLHNAVGAIVYDSVNSFFVRLRAYLQVQNDRLGANNDVYSLLKRTEDSSGVLLMNLGPQIDKGDTPQHFHFPSGSRMSFGVTLRSAKPCSLVAYRFHYEYRSDAPGFMRFDLNSQRHSDPLSEPRCHLHPGLDNVRIPTPALTPFEILDRIFFVLEPA